MTLHAARPYAPRMATTAIGRRLRALREGQGMTQVALARAARLDRITIIALEVGRHRRPTADSLVRLARALGTTPDDLLGVQ